MSDLFSKSLREVLAVSASSDPTPGGGSVSAICASFAAAMAAMVANLTIGKKKYQSVQEQVERIRDEAMGLMEKLEKLVASDMACFGKFMDAYKLPKSTPEEASARENLIQEALKDATETPLEIARTCLRLLEIVEELSSIGNKMAISDAGVAAYLGEASLKSALLSVDINVPQIADQSYVAKVLEEKKRLVARAQELKDKAVDVVISRLK